MNADKFYLQDSRSNVGSNAMWWAKAGHYTTALNEAQVFTQEEAQAQHNCRESDIPWPVEHIDQRSYRAVDCQYVSSDLPLAEDGLFYAAKPRDWDGNNLLWFGSNGATANLSLAKAYTKHEIDMLCMTCGCKVFPKDHVDQHARKVVSVDHVNSKTRIVIKAAGIVLQKPRKPKYQPINCGHCGRFLSERQQYGDCPNCGGDNRP